MGKLGCGDVERSPVGLDTAMHMRIYDLEAQTTGSYQAIGREADCSKVCMLVQETSKWNGKRGA